MIPWYFRPQRPDEIVRNPVQGEYFSDEAIERPAQALVREAIQNSLDAAADDDEGVSVRFYVSGTGKALDPVRATFWFGDAWAHLTAPGNGLRDVPSQPHACPFLVVEDFGTTGLNGDPAQWEPSASSVDNRFFAFFRAEGVSEKAGEKGGRWGVGKTVFPRSSRVSTLLALTVRHDDSRRLLMGHTTLFYHRLDDRSFTPDGFLGAPDARGVVLPLEDGALIDRFIQDFSLHRAPSEPGLSVVVPYFEDEITTQHILDAVIAEYFYPILTGRLLVRVNGPGQSPTLVDLNADTLLERISQLEASIEPGLGDVIDLAVWAREAGQRALVTLEPPDPTTPPEWTDGALPEDHTARLADSFEKGHRIALRVPLSVRCRGSRSCSSYFDVYLQRDLQNQGYPPVFLRNGIRIPKVRERRVKGHRIVALVVIEDKPLASLLGDAEVPAHTRWSPDTRRFKGRYEHGKAMLEFVSEAPRQLAEMLSKSQEKRDRLLLADFFPRPPEEPGAVVKPDVTNEPGVEPECPQLPDETQPAAFRVERINGGFRVVRGQDRAASPQRVEVRVAYDRSRGDPLRRYDLADFDVQTMAVTITGAAALLCKGNRLVLRIDDAEAFRAEVTGFDVARDLIVDIQALEPGDDQPN